MVLFFYWAESKLIFLFNIITIFSPLDTTATITHHSPLLICTT